MTITQNIKKRDSDPGERGCKKPERDRPWSSHGKQDLNWGGSMRVADTWLTGGEQNGHFRWETYEQVPETGIPKCMLGTGA